MMKVALLFLDPEFYRKLLGRNEVAQKTRGLVIFDRLTMGNLDSANRRQK